MRGFDLASSGRSRVCRFVIAMVLPIGAASAAKAAVLLGGFQGPGDPTDAGWIDVNNGQPITTDPNSSFVPTGVPGYPLSLQESGASTFANPSALELQFSPAQIAAFNANSYLTFTFSVPTGAATAGFNQIYNLAFNGTGYPYSNFMNGGSAAATWGTYSAAMGTTSFNQNGEPNFFFFAGDAALDSETVTINYSSILPAIMAGGEGFLQMTFQGNTGGGSPAIQDFNNIELSTGAFGAAAPVPEPVSASLIGLASLGLMARRQRRS
jgi:hypothetical protein